MEIKDKINPDHYKGDKFQPIDLIEDRNISFCLGNAIKYISRAGKKDKEEYVTDLKKSIWYIDRAMINKEYEEQRQGKCKIDIEEYLKDQNINFYNSEAIKFIINIFDFQTGQHFALANAKRMIAKEIDDYVFSNCDEQTL